MHAIRFNKLSHFENFLTKEQFRESMGILGLESASFLSDRIFDAIDENGDKQVTYWTAWHEIE
jgi:1-phosphatidylinositol-4-phosphate 5-kinase